MKLIRFFGYFARFRKLAGFRAAAAFALSYLWARVRPPRGGRLARVFVGPYVFYFPSLAYFDGLFSEIFLNETYYLDSTDEPIFVLDCGANIGVSLLYIKFRAPHARVICFEPSPGALSVLEKNVAANGWEKDVRIVPVALGKEKGITDFFVENKVASSSGGSVSDHLGRSGRTLNSFQVKVDTLSSYISGPVDLVKMDIEGGEFGVMADLLAKDAMRQVKAFQLEYHYIPGFATRPLSEMLTLLEAAGFKTFIESLVPPHKIVGRSAVAMHACMVFAWRE